MCHNTIARSRRLGLNHVPSWKKVFQSGEFCNWLFRQRRLEEDDWILVDGNVGCQGKRNADGSCRDIKSWKVSAQSNKVGKVTLSEDCNTFLEGIYWTVAITLPDLDPIPQEVRWLPPGSWNDMFVLYQGDRLARQEKAASRSIFPCGKKVEAASALQI